MATNKKFKVDFCTVAHWKEKRIVEENLFYDLVGMMRQLDLTRPNCTSILQSYIFDFEQHNKPIKVPNKMQCLSCSEVVTIYHPSALS